MRACGSSKETAAPDDTIVSRMVVEQSPALIAVCDAEGRYLFANEEFAAILGQLRNAIVGRDEMDVLGDIAGADALRVRAPCIGARPACAVENVELHGRRRRFLTTRYPLRDRDGAITAFCLSATELPAPERCDDPPQNHLEIADERNNELRRALEQMERLAYTDRLTGAWNRRHLDDIALVEMSRTERHGLPVSLLLLDIDHFKALNDAHGHDAGDRALVDFVRCVRAAVRRADTVVRWGGEEFIVLAPDTPLPEAIKLAEKLRECVRSAVAVGARPVTVSIGVAEYQSGEGFERWVGRADRVLYAAKSEGRDQVVADPATAYGDGRSNDKPTQRGPLRLAWRDAYRSGDSAIDAEHEALFELANDILDAVISGAPRDVVLKVYRQALDNATVHFADEERVLLEVGYPDRRAHALEHAALVRRARQLGELGAAGKASPAELFQFLAYEVIAQHLLISDRRFFPYLERRRDRGEPARSASADKADR